MSIDRSGLHPVLLVLLEKLETAYALAYPGERLLETSGLRSDKQQVALYAQGRHPLDFVNTIRKFAGMGPVNAVENGHVVTHADGVKVRSNHQGKLFEGKVLGSACDLAPVYDHDALDCHGHPLKAGAIDWDDSARFARIGPLAKNLGLRWGGDFVNPRTGEPETDLPHVELAPE